MPKLVVVALALTLGCSESREQQCQKVLDTLLEQAPKNIEEAIAASEADAKAALRAQGEKEIGQLREKFVGACKAAENFDPACYLDKRNKTDACRKITRQINDAVYH